MAENEEPAKPKEREIPVFTVLKNNLHGTWISGKRIEPGVRMKLNDSDMLRLGASSRLYRLNWVPLSSAYDLDKPFLPQLDTADTIEEEDDGVTDQDENSLSYRNDHVETLSEDMEGLEVLCSDEDLDKKSGLSIWSRRGKPENVKIETSRSRGNCARINMSSQVKSLIHENYRSESILSDQCASPDNNEETFTPDKENMSPNSLLVRSLKGKGKQTLKSESILKISVSSMDQDEEEIYTPDKENMTPKSHLLWSNKQLAVLKARADRDPFNPLSVNSTSHKSKASSKPSVHEDSERGSINYPDSVQVHHSHNNTMKVVKNRWIIVVDTACLLNKKSRKELQLLRGLHGTTLVIPRIVVRELDCMLRRGSFFTRMTEVSAALQWIEECMAVAKWWIHIQSSVDEGQLIPPTPPASPHWSSEDKSAFPVGSISFSPYSLQEIVTPTATDHILQCALFFKQTMKNEQLVLLTDDVTLKIKAMAEGVICETAQEFRGSLVNPFSSRFLYSDSSPIGPTWSCVDDVVLKEKYYPSPSKKLSKSGEGAKGLKLILLHNSKFRQTNPVSPNPLAENRS
ncbi:UNVERIFIED_CONTAM: FHA domain-containing protein PS1 [Sesamum radiatum]|uniref:FHA domain-containing protein PS1 n=1 Tax=Sesamum radiatum TaxID=300843 RepID=A0AAW2PX81_SESRA